MSHGESLSRRGVKSFERMNKLASFRHFGFMFDFEFEQKRELSEHTNITRELNQKHLSRSRRAWEISL